MLFCIGTWIYRECQTCHKSRHLLILKIIFRQSYRLEDIFDNSFSWKFRWWSFFQFCSAHRNTDRQQNWKAATVRKINFKESAGVFSSFYDFLIDHRSDLVGTKYSVADAPVAYSFDQLCNLSIGNYDNVAARTFFAYSLSVWDKTSVSSRKMLSIHVYRKHQSGCLVD